MLPNLPAEILLEIFSYLDPASLTRVAQASRDFHQIALDQNLWKQKLKLHFPTFFYRHQHTEVLDWYITFRDTDRQRYNGFTILEKRLFSCIKEGDVKQLRELGFNWDMLQGNSWFLAAAHLHQVVLDFFYSLAAAHYRDHLQQDANNRTLLHWAITCHQSSAIKNLIAQSRLNGNFNINNIFLWIAENGYSQDIDLLIAEGANVNAVDNWGCTPLHWAARGHIDVARALLDKGANVDAVDNEGLTPLHLAASEGWSEIVRALIDKGAKVNAVDNDGSTFLHWTSLHWASSRGHVDVVRALLDKGADVNTVDNDGHIPLDYAKAQQNNSIIELLTPPIVINEHASEESNFIYRNVRPRR